MDHTISYNLALSLSLYISLSLNSLLVQMTRGSLRPKGHARNFWKPYKSDKSHKPNEPYKSDKLLCNACLKLSKNSISMGPVRLDPEAQIEG